MFAWGLLTVQQCQKHYGIHLAVFFYEYLERDLATLEGQVLTLPTLLLPYLVEGYREVAYLPPDYEQRISLSSLLIAIRTLARTISRSPENIHDHQGLKSIRRDIQVLLT